MSSSSVSSTSEEMKRWAGVYRDLSGSCRLPAIQKYLTERAAQLDFIAASYSNAATRQAE